MATKNLNLGTVPVSRGEFNSTTIYYKDNIVQYKRGSYQVISESPIVGVPPINDEDIVNNGWIIFAGTLSKASLIKSNTQDLSGNNVQENLNSAAEKLKELESEVIYDISAHNNNKVFESLSALLNSSDLSTLIPASVRHGGMSIRFIQSSDNKYMQYRLMTDTFNTTPSNWQGVDDIPTIGSDNLVKSGGVANKLAELEVEVSGVRYSKNIPSSIQNMIISKTILKSGLSYNIKFNIDVVPLNEIYFRFKDADGNNVPLKINGESFTEPFNIEKGKTEAEFKNISVDVDSEVNITYLRFTDIYSGTATISVYLETGLRKEVEQLEYDQKQLETRFDTQIGNEALINSSAIYKQGNAKRGATKNTAGDIVVTTSPNQAVWQLVIGVVAGQTISINGYGADRYRLWALADNNGHIISKSQGSLDATSTPQLVFVESNCTLIVSCYDNYISSLKVVVNTKGLAELTHQSYKMFEGIFGKKMYFIGDSIMIGRPNEEDTLNITTHIANMTGSNCVNLARGGSLFMYPWALGNQNSIYQQLTQVPSDADCVIVQGGVNGVEMTDPNKPNYAPMGEISDSFDADFNKATQIGCLEAICKYLHDNFCGKKVGFIMTYQIGDYSYWKNKAKKFAEVLDKWSIPILDWRESGISLASPNLASKWGIDAFADYDNYDTNAGYSIDDRVIYDNKCYKAEENISVPAGAFDVSKWTLISSQRYDNWHCNGLAYKALARKTAEWLRTL